MIKYCLDKWEKNKDKLERALKDHSLRDTCGYGVLVKLIVEHILNDGDPKGDWNKDEIRKIDDGDYQGTLLFLIQRRAYQPSEYDYILTFINYGSCSVCDTLEHIQEEGNIADYINLCRDITANMIVPYNYGWREKEEYKRVEDITDTQQPEKW